MKRVVFIDRDGTIIREPADKQIDTLEKLEFLPGIIGGLKQLRDAGYMLVMVSNQDGLGTASYPRKAYEIVQGKILRLLKGEGISFEKILICPHDAGDGCECRKPKIGLIRPYLEKNSIDHARSFVLGDRVTDVELAKNIGVRAVRIAKKSGRREIAAEFTTPDAYEACSYIARASRTASMERSTNETKIAVTVSIDGTGKYNIATGLRFFDHMLAQLSRHSRFDITLKAAGDLDIDEHHTVEDCGIALGTALGQALGEKRGIDRFGFAAPLDEALAQASIDLSGRRHLTFNCYFRREFIGDLPTELIEDFFRSLAGGLQASIHITCRGRNDHHKAEAIFKATALALRNAARLDPRFSAQLPTTKGML